MNESYLILTYSVHVSISHFVIFSLSLFALSCKIFWKKEPLTVIM